MKSVTIKCDEIDSCRRICKRVWNLLRRADEVVCVRRERVNMRFKRGE